MPSVVEIQAQADQVRDVMQDNVTVMLSNMEKTTELENKSSELAAQAKVFHKSSKDVKRHFCRQNAKMNLLLGCICLIILVAIILSIALPIVNASAASGPAPAPSSPAPSPPARRLQQVVLTATDGRF